MKVVICDTCFTRTETDQYGSTPAPWLTVTTRADYKTADYCSNTCAVQALTASPVAAPTAQPVTSAQSQEFIDTGTFPPDPPVGIDHEVSRMHDDGNPNDVDEVAF